MTNVISESARMALAATDWAKLDALTDDDIAQQIAANPYAAPDMAPEISVGAIGLFPANDFSLDTRPAPPYPSEGF